MIQKIQKLIRESKKIICITGQEAMIECGGINLWSADNLYRIEKKYGKSPEEMLSAGELTTRKAYFFDFYKNEVLKNLPKPGPAYDAMKVLQPQQKELVYRVFYRGECPKDMDNISVRTDPAGNIKPDKEKSTERIDGAMAAIMALDRAIRCGSEPQGSIYDERDLLIL